MSYESFVNDYLFPGQTIWVRSWWYKDNRIVKCRVNKSFTSLYRVKYKTFSDDPDVVDVKHLVDVTPLKGNSHTRWIRVSEVTFPLITP